MNANGWIMLAILVVFIGVPVIGGIFALRHMDRHPECWRLWAYPKILRRAAKCDMCGEEFMAEKRPGGRWENVCSSKCAMFELGEALDGLKGDIRETR